MIKRPKNTDSEKELLEMQMEYMKEKERNANFQPAAKVVRKMPEKKQSEFAKQRGLKNNTNDTPTTTGNIVLGEIIERTDINMEVDLVSEPGTSSVESFPKVERIDTSTVPTKGISLFAQMRSENQIPDKKSSVPVEFGKQSYILRGDDAEQIHQQNINMLTDMSPEDLEKEREKLLQSIDPSTVAFLQKLRSQKSAVSSKSTAAEVANAPPPQMPTVIPQLAHEAKEQKWISFNEIEEEKLEWMKDVNVDVPHPKEGESYEARFDWKGTLLPFIETSSDDNRELFLHGDEPHRPGYTLQELFRLARSDVLQQRISALTSIQGILAIYNQGFYDKVLELPISKIFFLLRFSLDDQAMTVIDQALLGLANLFYNASDEFLLDCIFDTRLGRHEPVFQDAKTRMQLEYSFKNMSVNAYKTPVQDEEAMLNDDANLNDFHLAETDLVKCLLRTNIIERIQYLFNVMKPEKGLKVKESCVKILIGIARYGPDGIEKITENFHLIDGLIDSVAEEEDFPRTTGLIIKLLRLIIGYSIVPDVNLPVIMELAKKIIFNRDNLNNVTIKLQVEGLRLLRVILSDRRYQDSYNDFVPAIRYLFEWHYKFLDIADSRSALVHQHVTAMIALLSHKVFCFDRNLCTEIMVLCFRKWLTIASSWLHSQESVELGFSQNILLTVIVEFCTDHKVLYQALKDLWHGLVTSAGFNEKIIKSLPVNSAAVKILSDRSKILPQLRNFGAVAFDRDNKVNLIIPQNSSVILVNSIIQLFIKHDQAMLQQIIPAPFHEVLAQFTTQSQFVAIMKRNWFCRHDLDLVFTIIQSGICKDIALVVKATGLFVSCLHTRSQIVHLLQDIFFNPSMYPVKLDYSDGEILLWKDVYMQYYLMRQSTLETPDESLLPVKWPYEILNIFYEQHVESKDKKKISFNIEKDTEDRLIKVSMGLTTLLEANGVFLVSATDRLLHLMTAFLSPECRFLEPTVKNCLNERALFLKQAVTSGGLLQFKTETFDFESFYTVLLNQFQSSGYADKLFSALVMVPLSTQYEVKWRKMVWSEHVAVLRFISCSEDELIFTHLRDFTEKRKGHDDKNYELSLLKSYNQALNMKQLMPDSIPYKIAKFYMENK